MTKKQKQDHLNAPEKQKQYHLRAPSSLMEKVERVRGDIPRSTYIRRAVESYLRQARVVGDTEPQEQESKIS